MGGFLRKLLLAVVSLIVVFFITSLPIVQVYAQVTASISPTQVNPHSRTPSTNNNQRQAGSQSTEIEGPPPPRRQHSEEQFRKFQETINRFVSRSSVFLSDAEGANLIFKGKATLSLYDVINRVIPDYNRSYDRYLEIVRSIQTAKPEDTEELEVEKRRLEAILSKYKTFFSHVQGSLNSSSGLNYRSRVALLGREHQFPELLFNTRKNILESRIGPHQIQYLDALYTSALDELHTLPDHGYSIIGNASLVKEAEIQRVLDLTENEDLNREERLALHRSEVEGAYEASTVTGILNALLKAARANRRAEATSEGSSKPLLIVLSSHDQCSVCSKILVHLKNGSMNNVGHVALLNANSYYEASDGNYHPRNSGNLYTLVAMSILTGEEESSARTPTIATIPAESIEPLLSVLVPLAIELRDDLKPKLEALKAANGGNIPETHPTLERYHEIIESMMDAIPKRVEFPKAR